MTTPYEVETFGLTTIGQVQVPVRDLQEAVEFYRDRLRIPLAFEAPPAMAFFRCGDVTLMVGVPEDGGLERTGSIVYFAVEDVAAAHEILAERGVPFVSEPHVVHRAEDHELWMAFFRDPSGNVHALMARKAMA